MMMFTLTYLDTDGKYRTHTFNAINYHYAEQFALGFTKRLKFDLIRVFEGAV